MTEGERPTPELSEDRVAQLRQAIREAPSRIEDEFSRTANDWLSCFGSTVFVIETYMSSPKYQAAFPPEALVAQEQAVEAIKIRLHALKQQYPEKDPQPPDAVKHELLEALQVFLE